MRYTLLYILITICSLGIHAQDEQDDSVAIMPEEFVDASDTLVTDSVVRWPQSLYNHLDELIYKSELLQTSQLGMMVYDLDADSTIFAYNGRQTMRPASIMKVITAITALDHLGGSYQFKTYLKYTGEVIDSLHTLNGDVIIVGGMDPRLGRDDLTAFAESLKKFGIDTIRGNVCVDRSMKIRAHMGEGWCWDDENPILTPTIYNRKDEMAEAFFDILKANRIVVQGSSVERTAPANAKDVCSRFHTIDQVLMKMMKDSDNLFAECMYYQIALSQGKPANADKAKVVERNLITKIGLKPSNYRLADGSGLSLYNYVSPELEVKFLRYAYRNSNIYNHFVSSLPVAGIDGTLAKRMKGTSASGNVRAKTGTLTGISSLAGYATAHNGHKLAFCIINQGVMHTANAKAFQDKVCVALTK